MIEYRLAQPFDAEAIANLHARSWRENNRGAAHDAFLDDELHAELLRMWCGRLNDAPGNQLIQLAVDGANLVGFICAYGAHDPQWGSYIDNLHVAHPLRRRGIGAALMRHGGRWLAAMYPRLAVYLLVLESNASARRFYERLGAQNAGVLITKTHGGAVVRNCRYTWSGAEGLNVA
ncbi:MAG: GNAT family N-acetyltransferase [Caldilineaceae bacterium]